MLRPCCSKLTQIFLNNFVRICILRRAFNPLLLAVVRASANLPVSSADPAPLMRALPGPRATAGHVVAPLVLENWRFAGRARLRVELHPLV